MLVSCICVCHNKPDVTQEAIQSIINQSYPHWEAIVVDSGVLYDAGYYDRFAWRQDPRVKLIRSEETDEIRRTRAMAPWCFNACFRKGLVLGDLVLYLCDDDLLYAHAFATFVAYCRQHPHAQAMYASQDLAVIYPNGWRAIVGERRATALGGAAATAGAWIVTLTICSFVTRGKSSACLPRMRIGPKAKNRSPMPMAFSWNASGSMCPSTPSM